MFSRVAAASGVVGLVLGSLGVFVTYLGAMSLGVSASSGVAVLSLGLMLLLSGFIAAVTPTLGPGGESTVGKSRFQLSVRGTVATYFIALLLYSALVRLGFDWGKVDAALQTHPGRRFPFVFGLAIGALLIGPTVEFIVVLFRVVLEQVRGLRAGPFDAWSTADHASLRRSAVFTSRFPNPEDGSVSRMQAKTFAAYAEDAMHRFSMVGQLLALVGGGMFSAAIPVALEPSSRTVGAWIGGLGVLLGTVGFRISTTTAALWRARSEAYRRRLEGKPNVRGVRAAHHARGTERGGT